MQEMETPFTIDDLCNSTEMGGAPTNVSDGNGGGEDEVTDKTGNKVESLFSQVLEVYWDKYAESKDNNLELLNIANCRLVCKAWKKGMDDLLNSSDRTWDNTAIHPRRVVVIENGNLKDVQDKLNIWFTKEKFTCPFPPQELVIQQVFQFGQTSSPADLSESGKAINKFLKRFGRGLRKFSTISVDNVPNRQFSMSLPYWYIIFQRWISLMPNIIELEVDVPVANDELESIQGLTRLHPMPKLKRLEYVNMSCRYELNVPTLQILTANNHISIPHLRLESISEEWDLSLPNLVQLGTHVSQNSELKNLSLFAGCPLHTLEIKCADTVKLSKSMFQVIETFKDLTCLSVPHMTYTTDYRPLNLPKLKTLTIGFYSASDDISWAYEPILEIVSKLKLLECLNFSVRNISRTVEDSESNDEDENQEDNNFVDKAWALLPALKQVRIIMCASGMDHLFIRPSSMDM